MVAVAVVSALAGGAVIAQQSWTSAAAESSRLPWFAGYVDATVTPLFPFEAPETDGNRDVLLSFVVAAKDDECTPTWGAAYSLDEAAEELDLDRRIARLRQQEGTVAISLGGFANDELATTCRDAQRLKDAYSALIDRYDVTTLDFDIEDNDLSTVSGGERRARAVAELQTERRAAGEDLAIWLTLPAATFGLTEEGTTAVAQMLEGGVDLAGVNIMTMNFGQSLDEGESMGEASIRALTATHRQLKALYQLADQEVSDSTLWRKLGATPMIGQNDHVGEVFTMQDAEALNGFAVAQGIGRMSLWSSNRDFECGPNYVDVTRVSNGCSGVEHEDRTFVEVLGTGFAGRMAQAAGDTTTPEPRDPDDFRDNPERSPYPIWSEDAAYLKGTKIVWHRNVYEAKWWTSGELPDSPVLNEWETPWTLIGPVLDDERPIPVPTLPPGSYPEWEGTHTYDKKSRVLFEGVPYQAKWWNQGESPEASHSNPDGSPWTALDVKDVKEELGRAD